MGASLKLNEGRTRSRSCFAEKVGALGLDLMESMSVSGIASRVSRGQALTRLQQSVSLGCSAVRADGATHERTSLIGTIAISARKSKVRMELRSLSASTTALPRALQLAPDPRSRPTTRH